MEFSKKQTKNGRARLRSICEKSMTAPAYAKPTTDCQMGNTSTSDAIWTATAEILFCPIAIFYSRFASSFCTYLEFHVKLQLVDLSLHSSLVLLMRIMQVPRHKQAHMIDT